MEKILLILNSKQVDVQTLEFACYMAHITRSKLSGLFVENAKPELLPSLSFGDSYFREIDDVGPVQNRIVQMDKEQSIRFFKENCKRRNVACDVLEVKKAVVKGVIFESRFADLLIADGSVASNKKTGGKPSGFIKEIMAAAECPVVMAPETFEKIDEVVFCYNGSRSAAFAIRQFTYLLPVYHSKKVTVLKIKANDEPAEEESDRKMLGWLKAHYAAVHFQVLEGDVRNELPGCLSGKKKAFVVMGAYGRRLLSYLFTPISADPLIHLVDLPIFIAHY